MTQDPAPSPPPPSGPPAPACLETSAQIAARYNVADRTVLNWLYRGIIPAAIRVRKVVRFDPAEVDRALRRHPAE